MEMEEHECQIVIDKDTDCSQIPELNAINYVKGFRILKNPSDVDYADNVDDGLIEENEEILLPKPEVCINLDDDKKLCVELALNEALSEPTKVRGCVFVFLQCFVYCCYISSSFNDLKI